MTKKWNLQDIHPNDRKKPARAPASRPSTEKSTAPKTSRRDQEASSVSYSRQKKRGKGGILLKVSIVLVVLAVLAVITTVFLRGADVVVYPKNKDVTVQADFSAYTTPTAGELGYELLTLEAEAERQVNATGKEEVSERTEGKITIYNSFSQNSVRLVKNTRFESPNGLIFKITESAVVPGYTGEGADKVPGSVTADVFADGTGEEYNLDATRFTIPGFEGEPEFEGVYAESSQPFSGGFEGEKYIIDTAELETAKASLHEELREALRARLESERPAGFVLYDEAVTFSFQSLASTDDGDGLATIKERGSLHVPIFNAADFASYLAQKTVAGYEGEAIRIDNPLDLNFRYESASSTTDIGSQNTISFKLSGDVTLVWDFEEKQLKTDLAGLAKSALPTVLSGYTAIEKAEATIRPFWNRSFPEDTKHINLKIILE